MSLEATLDATVRGDAVELALTVTNASTEVVELTFRSAQTAEFVARRDGEDVWRYGEERAFAQALRTERLEPGEAATYGATWTEAPPGEYRVVATLASRPGARAEATVTV